MELSYNYLTGQPKEVAAAIARIIAATLSRIYVVIYGFRGLTPQQIGNKKENENGLLTLNQTEYQRSEEYC